MCVKDQPLSSFTSTKTSHWKEWQFFWKDLATSTKTSLFEPLASCLLPLAWRTDLCLGLLLLAEGLLWFLRGSQHFCLSRMKDQPLSSFKNLLWSPLLHLQKDFALVFALSWPFWAKRGEYMEFRQTEITFQSNHNGRISKITFRICTTISATWLKIGTKIVIYS